MTITPEYLTDSACRLATLAGKEARSLSSGVYMWPDSRRRLATRLLLDAAMRMLPPGEHDPVSRVLDALHDYLLLKTPFSAATEAWDNLRLCRILRVLGELSGVVAIDIVKSTDAGKASQGAEDDEYQEPTLEDLIRDIAEDVVKAATGARA